MLRSVKRDAVRNQKFYFRRNFYGEKARDTKYKCASRNPNNVKAKRELFESEELIELTLEELMQGGASHQGFKGLIEEYIRVNEQLLSDEAKRTGEDSVSLIWQSYHFFLNRATGKAVTSAKLIREFIRNHPLYNHDSVVEGELSEKLIEFIFNVQTMNDHPKLFLKS